MAEIIVLLIVFGAFLETAKRRGVTGWPFIIVGVLGWLVINIVGAAAVTAGPRILLAWVWIGMTYVSIFLIGGGGRRMKESWQCPECRFWNSPATLVCLCGYDPTSKVGGPP
jgi:hypothetical protein